MKDKRSRKNAPKVNAKQRRLKRARARARARWGLAALSLVAVYNWLKSENPAQANAKDVSSLFSPDSNGGTSNGPQFNNTATPLSRKNVVMDEAAITRLINDPESSKLISPKPPAKPVKFPREAVEAAISAQATASSHFGRPCSDSWPFVLATLVGESDAGTYGGRSVLSNGEESSPISSGDIENPGLGPAQFNLRTWQQYDTNFNLDGDGNRVEDPQNIFDAAEAIALYECENTPDIFGRTQPPNLSVDQLKRAWGMYCLPANPAACPFNFDARIEAEHFFRKFNIQFGVIPTPSVKTPEPAVARATTTTVSRGFGF